MSNPLPLRCRWLFAFSALSALCLVALPTAGCKRKAATPSKSGAAISTGGAEPTGTGQPAATAPDYATAPADGLELLQRLVAAYQAAPAYQDNAVAVLEFNQDGKPGRDEAPLSVRFQRATNQLSVRAYQASIECQQGRLQAQIDDQHTDDFDQQVLEKKISSPLRLNEVLADPVLNDMLNRGIARTPIVLEMLFGDQPLQFFLRNDVKRELLATQNIDGHDCLGVSAGPPQQQFRFWVDKSDYLLRRMEMPAGAIEQASSATDVRLRVEFRNASFVPGERASLASYDQPKRVQHFVPPPQPLPTLLYGKQPKAFRFARSTAAQSGDNSGWLDSEQFADKPTVLAWFSEHPACQATLQQLAHVRKVWGDDAINFFAVCSSPATVPNDDVLGLWKQWGVRLAPESLVRDLEAFGRDVFQVPSVPTLVVLGADQKLHVFDVGFNPNLPQELDLVLRMLQAGEDVSEQVVRRAENERAAYRQDLVAAGATGVNVDFPVNAATKPERFKLTPQWTVTSVQSPGNMVSFESNGQSLLAILDGMRTVTVLDASGEVTESRELDLPQGAAVSSLRTSANPRRFLAAAPGGEQIAIFDEQWKRIAMYPSEPLHEGILDAVLLPGSTPAALIGYRHAGLHRADETNGDYVRSWTNRDCDSPLALDVLETGEGWRVMATDPAGQFYIFSASGKKLGGPAKAAGWPLFYVRSSQFPYEDGAVICGLSYDALGQRVLVGLDLDLKPRWQLALPGGSFETAVESIASGVLLDRGCWALASPDGSINLISADGEWRDQFYCGAMVRGLAITARQELVIATAKEVRCYRLAPIP